MGKIRKVIMPRTGAGNDPADWKDDEKATQQFEKGIQTAINTPPTPDEINDDYLAQAFVNDNLDTLRWSPGMGWMVYDGTRWTRDEKLARFDRSRKLARRVAAYTDKSSSQILSTKTISKNRKCF